LGEDRIVTTGVVSSLAGLGNDRRNLQISAPIQPGNSGGPVLGEDDALLGVAVSSIGTLQEAQVIGGAVPQNANFAVSTGTLQSFLSAHNVAYVLTNGSEPKKNSAEIASLASRFTVMIECWK
jgi:S1-C subfamily serine protease